MIQLIGWCAFGIVGLIAAVWVWQTFVAGKTTVGTSTVGKYISAILNSTQLSANLGYIEILKTVDAVAASPEATEACGVVADCLWAAAKAEWAAAQVATPPAATPATVSISPDVANLQKAVAILAGSVSDLAAKVNSQTTSTPPAASAAQTGVTA